MQGFEFVMEMKLLMVTLEIVSGDWRRLTDPLRGNNLTPPAQKVGAPDSPDYRT